MTEDDDISSRIVFALMMPGIPLSLTQIASKIGVPHQNVSYHIDNLVSKGLVIPVEEEGSGRRLFITQPIFINEELFEELFSKAIKLVLFMHDNGIWSKSEDEMESIRECVRVVLELIELHPAK